MRRGAATGVGGKRANKRSGSRAKLLSKGKTSAASVGVSISCLETGGRLTVPASIEVGVRKGTDNGAGFHESTRWRRRRAFLAGGWRSLLRGQLFGRLIGAGLACSATTSAR